MTTSASKPEPTQALSADIQLPRQRAGSPSEPAQALPATAESRDAGALLTVLGGVLVVVGSLLPWFVIGSGHLSRSVGALDGIGDWIITLALGAVALAIGVVRRLRSLRPILQRAPILVSWLVGVVAAASMTRIHRAPSDLHTPHLAAGIGLYLLIVGAVVLLVGGMFVTPWAANGIQRRPR